MKEHARLLFGGALASAGLQVAHASPQFQVEDPFNYGSPIVLAAYEYDYFQLFGVRQSFDSLPAYVSAYGNSASVSFTEVSLFARGSSDLSDYGYSHASADLSVSKDAFIDVSWDFTSFGGGIFIRGSNGIGFLLEVAERSAGNERLVLEAGIEYEFFMSARARGSGQSGFATVTLAAIPAPGAAGVLGAAGLIAARRRR